MKSRRDFLKSTAFAGIAIIAAPNLAFTNTTKPLVFSDNDLIGRGRPKLYGNGYKLLKSAYQAYLEMNQAAEKDGFTIRVVSSYRTFNHQNLIWTRKYKRYRSKKLTAKQAVLNNIRYTAIPGSSRHHWGTEIDVVNGRVKTSRYPLNTKNYHGYGIYKNFREWMDANAHKYGYYQVYTNEHSRKGFKYEPWHYSYADLGVPMLKAYRERQIEEILKEQQLLGRQHFTENFIETYTKNNIMGINKNLLF